jgi:hypothetical protein
VTWNTTAPYEYLSVSKPLTYSGTNQADPIFTTAIAWDHPSKSHHGLGLNHGFLDDIVLISFGVVCSLSFFPILSGCDRIEV